MKSRLLSYFKQALKWILPVWSQKEWSPKNITLVTQITRYKPHKILSIENAIKRVSRLLWQKPSGQVLELCSELLVSNLDQNPGYIDSGLLLFLSVSPSKCRHSTSVLNNPFFPNPFQLTVYQPYYHSTLYSLGYLQRHKTLHHEKLAIQVVPASKPHVMKAHGTWKTSYVAPRWVSGLFRTSNSFITVLCPLERRPDGITALTGI
jgi:hypothetical protein